MTRLALLALVLLAACATPVTAPAPESATYAESADATLDPTFCERVFSPEPALLDEVTAAAARWSAATGCDVRVGDGGIPVTLVGEGWVSPAGLPADGKTETTGKVTALGAPWTAIGIEIAASHRSLTVAHEMGHALAWSDEHVAGKTALMCHDGGKGRITEDDVTYVCSGALNCQSFVPEA